MITNNRLELTNVGIFEVLIYFYRNTCKLVFLLLLLLLSRFSRVRLCATPWTAAHQAPPSLGFPRQEHWSGLPFPSPMHESEKWKWSPQSCPTSSDPMDCSLPGSSVYGIFQARVLEWGATELATPFCLSLASLSLICPSTTDYQRKEESLCHSGECSWPGDCYSLLC